MLRFRHGRTVVLMCFLSQVGMVLAIGADAHVRGTVLFHGTVPEAETMRVTANTELCG